VVLPQGVDPVTGLDNSESPDFPQGPLDLGTVVGVVVYKEQRELHTHLLIVQTEVMRLLVKVAAIVNHIIKKKSSILEEKG
jgi:hypothetical protein